MKMHRNWVLIGAAIWGLWACGDDADGHRERVPTKVLSVELSTDSLTLGVGESSRLGVTLRGQGDFDSALVWESSDPAVATVEAGLVTAIAEGEATIQATSVADPSKSAAAQVEVRPSPFGSLLVRIEGLPDELQAGIRVEGPEGFAITVNATTSLVALTPGAYRLEAFEKEDEKNAFVPKPTIAEVELEAGTTATVSIQYTAEALPLFRIESEGVSLPLFGVADLPVTIRRLGGFSGPVELRMENLHAGVTAVPVRVGPSQSAAKVRLVSAGASRVLGPRAVVIVGEAEGETIKGTTSVSLDAVVTVFEDSGPGTLRNYLELVPELSNAKGGPIAITFAPTLSPPITLQVEETLVVTGNVILEGLRDWRGPIVELRGVDDQLMRVEEGARLEIRSLSFRDGFAQENGGAIENHGALTVRDSTFRGCHASNGGAIFNAGSLTVERSIFENNGSSNGGAVYNVGDASLREVIVRNHESGGAVVSDIPPERDDARLLLVNVHFLENQGGAIGNYEGALDAQNCIFEGNSAVSGAALDLGGGSARLESCTFLGNGAQTLGGAIFADVFPKNEDELVLEVIDGFFSGNEARDGGAITTYDRTRIAGCTFTDNRASGTYGGAVYIAESGRLDVVESRFLGNRAKSGGAIYASGELRLEKSLISGENTTTFNGGGLAIGGNAVVLNSTIAHNESSLGGGIFVAAGGSLTLLQSTVTANTATTSGGGINVHGSMTTSRSILAGNNSVFAPDIQTAVDGSASTEGHNLFGDLTDSGLTLDPTDLAGVDPMLGELGNHGGPTHTIELLAESPAIDAIPAEECLDDEGEPLLEDQRGRKRPAGEGCDIGAFEAQ